MTFHWTRCSMAWYNPKMHDVNTPGFPKMRGIKGATYASVGVHDWIRVAKSALSVSLRRRALSPPQPEPSTSTGSSTAGDLGSTKTNRIREHQSVPVVVAVDRSLASSLLPAQAVKPVYP